jgi:hypothetical protein
MAAGAAAVALFWLALAGLVLRPAGFDAPLLWPAVFLAALLAWVQAITWTPFPLPLLRILTAVPVLGGLAGGALYAHSCGTPPELLLAASAALLPAGWAAAVVGVARARRGDAPAWGWPALRRRTAAAAPRRPFASAAAALLWLEGGRAAFFPFTVALLSLAQAALVGFGAGEGPAVLVGFLIYPPLFAVAAGLSLGNAHPWSLRAYAVPPFVAVRPVTSARVVAAKLKAAALATLAAWAVAVAGMAVVLPFSPAAGLPAEWARRLVETQGLKGGVLLALIVLGLPALTWKLVVDQLWVALAGRRWLVVGYGASLPAAVTGLALMGAAVVQYHETHGALLAAAPWAAGLALLLKLGAGVLVGRALVRRGLVAAATVRRFAAGWVAAAVVLFGLGWWLTPAEVVAPFTGACAAVFLVLPLVRLGLAPLALDWNRCR